VHLPFALVLTVALAGMVLVALQHWRRGAAVIGGALLLAAALRAVLPNERAGLIALRSRGVDVLLYGALGLVILVVALTIVGGPFDTSAP
jgi:multisubunit Na+/H+ antiporter MnhB subunit